MFRGREYISRREFEVDDFDFILHMRVTYTTISISSPRDLRGKFLQTNQQHANTYKGKLTAEMTVSQQEAGYVRDPLY